MVEYYGWINVSMSYTDVESFDTSDLMNVVNQLKSKIDSEGVLRDVSSFKIVNGEVILRLDGVVNHFNEEVSAVLNLCRYVGKIAVGSYGILYLRDDENNAGRANEFIVYKLAKGKLEEHKDHLLSPCHPLIEE